MRFDLVRPCKHCPFRADVRPYLHPERVTQLRAELERNTFGCHETIDYDTEDGEGVYAPTTQHCAGALILNERDDRRSDMAQIAARLGLWEPERLDPNAPVYASWDAMEQAYHQEAGIPWTPMSADQRRARQRRSRTTSRPSPPTRSGTTTGSDSA